MEWMVNLPWGEIVAFAVSFIVGVLWKQPKVAKQILEKMKVQSCD